MSEYYDPTIDTLPRHAQRVLKKSKDLPIEMLLMCVYNYTDMARIGTSIARDFPSFGLMSDETQLQIMARALGFPTIVNIWKLLIVSEYIENTAYQILLLRRTLLLLSKSIAEWILTSILDSD
jgi:hypothetical protein